MFPGSRGGPARPSRLDPGFTEAPLFPKPVQLGFVVHGHADAGSCTIPSSSILRGGGKGGGGDGLRTAEGMLIGAAVPAEALVLVLVPVLEDDGERRVSPEYR